MGPLLTVILVQYRPDWAALCRTLASLLGQTCRDFELIIADDGSPDDCFARTRALLAAHGMAARFAKLTPNGGTVNNLRNGLRYAGGRWVLTISPGDCLYDADTLRWLLDALRRDEPRVAFGRLACYSMEKDRPCLRPGDPPFDPSPYAPGRFDARAAKRNLLLYDDGVSGAGLVYERALLTETIERMAGRVRFAEDFSVRLFAVQGVPVLRWDRRIAWYEVGSGISTDKTAASEARMLADWKAMLDLIRELYPRDWTVRAAHAYYFNDENPSRLVRGLVGRLIVPQWLPFKRAQKAWQPPAHGDLPTLRALCRQAEELAREETAQAADVHAGMTENNERTKEGNACDSLSGCD